MPATSASRSGCTPRDRPRRGLLARAGALSREGDDGVFAEDEPAEAVVTAYWDQVMGERRQLGQGQRLRRRLWAPFNPASFRRGSAAPD